MLRHGIWLTEGKEFNINAKRDKYMFNIFFKFSRNLKKLKSFQNLGC